MSEENIVQLPLEADKKISYIISKQLVLKEEYDKAYASLDKEIKESIQAWVNLIRQSTLRDISRYEELKERRKDPE